MNNHIKTDAAERIFEMIGELDENIIIEAEQAQLKANRVRRGWAKRISAIAGATAAACLCIVIAVGLILNRDSSESLHPGIDSAATIEELAEQHIQYVINWFDAQSRMYAENFVRVWEEQNRLIFDDWYSYLDNFYTFVERDPSESLFIDSRITTLELESEFTHILPGTTQLWRLTFHLQLDDPELLPFQRMFFADWEDGWMMNHNEQTTLLIVTRVGDELYYSSYIPTYIDTRVYTGNPWNREIALRMHLEYEGIFPPATFPGNHYIANFNFGSEASLSRMLLSQPFGENGIWVVERWMDMSGRWLTYAQPSDGNQNQTMPEYYAELQRQFDAGLAPWMSDPAEVALRYLQSVIGGYSPTAPINEVMPLPPGTDPFGANLFSGSQTFTYTVDPMFEQAIGGILTALHPMHRTAHHDVFIAGAYAYDQPFILGQVSLFLNYWVNTAFWHRLNWVDFAEIDRPFEWPGSIPFTRQEADFIFDLAFGRRYSFDDHDTMNPSLWISSHMVGSTQYHFVTGHQFAQPTLALVSQQNNTYTFSFALHNSYGLLDVTVVPSVNNPFGYSISAMEITLHSEIPPSPLAILPDWAGGEAVGMPPHFVPPTTNISERGRQAAEEFLSQFTTLFSVGIIATGDDNSPIFLDPMTGAHLTTPLVQIQELTHNPWRAFYDVYGNIITSAPFLRDVGDAGTVQAYAADFMLFDIHHNGIPCIIIAWQAPNVWHAFQELFSFVDGEYRSMGLFKTWPELFFSPNGELIVRYNNVFQDPFSNNEWRSEHGYYYLTFNNNAMEHALITPTGMQGSAYEFYMLLHFFQNNINTFMYGTGMPITSVEWLTGLSSQLRASITEQLPGMLSAPPRPNNEPSPYPHERQGFYTEVGDMLVFIYRPEDVALERFDAIHEIGHPRFEYFTVYGDDMLIGASRPIFNVTLITLEDGWDEYAQTITFTTLADSVLITESLTPSERVLITGYVGIGTLPWSGIFFHDEWGEQHFLAINHDNTDSPNWFLMWDITNQMRFRQLIY